MSKRNISIRRQEPDDSAALPRITLIEMGRMLTFTLWRDFEYDA